MKFPTVNAADVSAKCLYVVDYKEYCVWRVDPFNGVAIKWIHSIYPWSLSPMPDEHLAVLGRPFDDNGTH